VRRREELSKIKGYPELAKQIETSLKGSGRLFVRFSGTEPLIRVLVEGPDRTEISK
jgi:phosphoglucosamine mutase